MGHMADWRSVSRTVVLTDKFDGMPMDARLLYFLCVMGADDSGFIDCIRGIMTAHRLEEDAIQPLIENGYLYDLGGVYLVRHWHLHAGTVPTMYGDQLERMTIKNGVYHLRDGET